jgi:hypothetical protein
MRVAINLLTDHPDHPSGAHWFWTRVIPEMAKRLDDDEELHVLVSPRSRSLHDGYGHNVAHITFPWSNERPAWRTLSEHVYAPARLPRARIDVFSTLLAPLVKPAPGLVVHFKTLHAYTEPASVRPTARLYRRLSYPRTARLADAIILNSESLRQEVLRYLDVDEDKLHLIPEAVDHELFRPGDPAESRDHIARTYGITEPFVLFANFGQSSLDFEIRLFLADITNSVIVQNDVRFAVVEAFKNHGIEIPFPHLTLYMAQNKPGRSSTERRVGPPDVEQKPGREAVPPQGVLRLLFQAAEGILHTGEAWLKPIATGVRWRSPKRRTDEARADRAGGAVKSHSCLLQLLAYSQTFPTSTSSGAIVSGRRAAGLNTNSPRRARTPQN